MRLQGAAELGCSSRGAAHVRPTVSGNGLAREWGDGRNRVREGASSGARVDGFVEDLEG